MKMDKTNNDRYNMRTINDSIIMFYNYYRKRMRNYEHDPMFGIWKWLSKRKSELNGSYVMTNSDKAKLKKIERKNNEKIEKFMIIQGLLPAFLKKRCNRKRNSFFKDFELDYKILPIVLTKDEEGIE